MGYIYIVQIPECYNSIHEQDRRTYKIGMTAQDDPEDRLVGYVGIRSARIYCIMRIRNEVECENKLKALFNKNFELAPRGVEYFVGDIGLMMKLFYMITQEYFFDESTPSRVDSESTIEIPDRIDLTNINDVVNLIIKYKINSSKFAELTTLIKLSECNSDCLLICMMLVDDQDRIELIRKSISPEFGVVFAKVGHVFDHIKTRYYKLIIDALTLNQFDLVKKSVGDTRWRKLFG